jgi:glyoxylase-like metal-dependent hydrolase (beta-lactamase superfamily II)
MQTTPTRRAVTGLLVAGAASALPSSPWAAAPVLGYHTSTLGAFEITVVSDGSISLPFGLALPGRDPADVQVLYAAHGRTFEAFAGDVNVTLVRTPDALVAIDCGGGTDFMPTLGRYADNLERAGIAPDRVTHVVFTHAHPDHLWGVIDPLDGNSRFPNARHVMTAVERDHWLDPATETRMPEGLRGMAIGTARRLRELGDRIGTVAAGAEIVPGVALVDTGGHTPGHVSVLLTSGGERLLVGGDVLTNPIVSFAKPDWTWGTDADPARAATVRARTLDMLATDRVQLLGYHLPWPGLGRVERAGGAHRLVT